MATRLWQAGLLGLALVVPATAQEATKSWTFNDATVLKELSVSGDVTVDPAMDRAGQKGLPAAAGAADLTGDAPKPAPAGKGGALRLGPGGKAAWSFADQAQSGKVELWVYDDKSFPENFKAPAASPLWGVTQGDGLPTLLVGPLYASYISGERGYCSSDYLPGGDARPWQEVQWLSTNRAAGWHKWTFVMDPEKGLSLLLDDKPGPKFDWNLTRLKGISGIMLLGDGSAAKQVLWVDDVTASGGPAMQAVPKPPPPILPVPPPEDVTVLPPPAEQTATPYAKWERGFGKDPAFFPIAVWLQDPKRAKEFAACGINLYIGLWKGPTEQQLADLKAAGMRVICAQNEVGLAHKDDPTIAAWMHGDEPDNAQAFKGYWQEDKEKIKEGWPDLYARLNLAKNDYRGYGPSIPPKWIVRDYEELRAKDPSRPIILNLGQGVAWEKFIGRGERTGKLEDYPEYIKGCDIVSFDIYPAVAAPGVKGNLWYVARGVKRLREWGQDQRPVWNCIECTRIGNPNVKPTPAQVRAEVWMSLIHGSRGLIYFVHQFKPNFIEAALLVDPDMVAGVTATNQQIHALAPVLNSPTIADGVAVETQPKETPVHAIVKRHGGATYVFAVAMHDQETTATLRVKDLPAGAKLEVLGENREVAAANGAFNDHFTGYAVHLYRTR